ncbi:nuclear pore complex NUP155 isoform X2 [Olea europaea subsp. europaea]|uniref:Nuclear pore complex NUP155 isoform X2 n=1 Tax=Olea europaea subsp. europaea TaxID=158383 RepID=A0A8S0UJS4_OLEEU|nr:nuclear pore complex NUP155 isoform X2 [Olea europaea subsp. europaea]
MEEERKEENKAALVVARLIENATNTTAAEVDPRLLKAIKSVVRYSDSELRLAAQTLMSLMKRAESIGDEDIARALLAACKGAIEPVLNAYDQLLSYGAILPSPSLRLRLIRSVLALLREWAMSVFAQRMGTSATGASLVLGGTFSFGHTTAISQGVRDKITSAANRFMTEVRRLSLPQSQTEVVYRGFRELEESLLSSFPFERF